MMRLMSKNDQYIMSVISHEVNQILFVSLNKSKKICKDPELKQSEPKIQPSKSKRE